jgi:23S rRNA pseudouridine1911/1915/1917 synthase
MHYELKYGRMNIMTQNEFSGCTICDFLDYFHIGKSSRYELIQSGALSLNRLVVHSEEEAIRGKAVITIRFPSEEPNFTPAPSPCQVVYEDDLVYAAHKEPGLIVHGDPDDTSCLAAQAAAWQLAHGINGPVRFLHRLDEDTTGLVLFVKIPFFQPWFDAALAQHKVKREYLAITLGNGRVGQHFTYRQKIGRDRHNSGRYRFSDTGRPAVTKAVILARKGSYELIRCRLETGRTHQIRVHLSGNRHPIINDPLYGIPSDQFKNMGLWADRMEWENPITHETCLALDIPNADYAFFDKKSFR